MSNSYYPYQSSIKKPSEVSSGESMLGPQDIMKDSLEMTSWDQAPQEQHHQTQESENEMMAYQYSHTASGQGAHATWSDEELKDLLELAEGILKGTRDWSHVLDRFDYRTPAAIRKKFGRLTAK